jgi:hypothetical protein
VIDNESCEVRARSRWNLCSLGEDILVKVESDQPDAEITISSACRYAAQTIDWNKNRRNVTRIAAALTSPDLVVIAPIRPERWVTDDDATP